MPFTKEGGQPSKYVIIGRAASTEVLDTLAKRIVFSVPGRTDEAYLLAYAEMLKLIENEDFQNAG